MRHCQKVALARVAGIVLAAGSLSWAADAVVVENDVAVSMRDGVVLRADVYRPQAPGKYPALLQRTPYNKAAGAGFGQMAAQKGFAVIFQDVRGRYKSEGEWAPFVHESADGYDTIEWAASQPYSNGKVGMFGGSYVGATQMLAAISSPPHLAGICPWVTASNYHDGWTYQGGAFEQWFNESWTSGLAQDTLNRLAVAESNALTGVWTLPLQNYRLFNVDSSVMRVDAPNSLAPYFLDWLKHPNYDEYWKRLSIEDHFAAIKVPALHMAAWYDIFLGGSLRNFTGLQAHAGSEAARKGQHLIVTLGGHAGGGRKIGDVDFGPAAQEFNVDDLTVAYYEYLFLGAKNEFAGKPVRIFVMGANQWRTEDAWPLARAKQTRYYLHSAGHANGSAGDGALLTIRPQSGPPDQYTYKPSSPTPTVGGPLCCDATHLAPGPKDQRAVELRDDVLVYSTPPVTENLEITGPVQLELFAKSSAVDTDFTAKLVDVWPDGFSQNLTEGILRARYRDSQLKPDLLVPGQIYKLTIDLWATSVMLAPGHRLRLEVSSSNFPRFDRNLNTGEDIATGHSFISARNTIYHDSEHPSALIVPVVPAVH